MTFEHLLISFPLLSLNLDFVTCRGEVSSSLSLSLSSLVIFFSVLRILTLEVQYNECKSSHTQSNLLATAAFGTFSLSLSSSSLVTFLFRSVYFEVQYDEYKVSHIQSNLLATAAFGTFSVPISSPTLSQPPAMCTLNNAMITKMCPCLLYSGLNIVNTARYITYILLPKFLLCMAFPCTDK